MQAQEPVTGEAAHPTNDGEARERSQAPLTSVTLPGHIKSLTKPDSVIITKGRPFRRFPVPCFTPNTPDEWNAVNKQINDVNRVMLVMPRSEEGNAEKDKWERRHKCI